ncbi:mechanosensitive ion channel protein [Hahella sp. CCB-MM4]|uniref:mechanosensitive ion channel family protein n=1 Tax=Hahella sp. (strain CCB-MM4) TaxID=1926491 RepID=UPI000B9B206D|nr:mechanosensitive ion channel domain-containing protein [Hahella sp. CCB-MM4]OZG75330.1 mechanosensitive ion channel protein [Hahella sp. CCB-MM4]
MDSKAVDQLEILGTVLDPAKLTLFLLGALFLWVVNRLVRHLAQKLMESLPGHRFVILQTVTLFSFIWYLGGLYALIVGILQPPHELMLALGGSAVVAVGFALKDVAASLIAGLMLLFDRPFQVGDRVSFGDVYGEIVSIGLRSVRITTLDDNTVTIPNSRFITEVVSSGNAGAMDMMVVTDFYLALDADLKLAQDLVHEVLITSRYIYLKKPVAFTVSEHPLSDRLAIRLRAKAYVFDVHFEKAFQSDIVIRTEALFQAQNIKRPGRDMEPAPSPLPLPIYSSESP